jgi:hypothetical protein
MEIQILHIMSTAHFLQLFTYTYYTLKDLSNIYVLLTHLTATTQHQSQYILQGALRFRKSKVYVSANQKFTFPKIYLGVTCNFSFFIFLFFFTDMT